MTTRTVIVGAGRVGGALAAALPPSGYGVAIVGRGDDLAAETRNGELVVLCVPDDVLTGVVRGLARDEGVAEGSRWVHVSGGHGLAVLRPVRLAGARVAACHPAHTFPDAERGRAGLPGVVWAVTAEQGDRQWAHDFVADLGGRGVDVAEGARRLYHAGLVLASNATVAVVALAGDLLRGAGIQDPGGFLQPLATASAANAAEWGAAALTGPVRRGDAGTVAAHLEELAATMPEAVEAYRTLSRLALAYARRAGLDRAGAEQVAAVLE